MTTPGWGWFAGQTALPLGGAKTKGLPTTGLAEGRLAAERLTMPEALELLRLKWELRLSISPASTISRWMRRMP